MTDDELRALFDPWWKRRSPKERTHLIEHRHGEFGHDYWQIVMDADPIKPDGAIVAVTSTTDSDRRFRIASASPLAAYLDLTAREQGTDY